MTNAREEIFFRACAGNFGIRRAGGSKRVSVAAAKRDLSCAPREPHRVPIVAKRHQAVERFHRGKIFLEPFEILFFARPGKAENT